MYNPDELLQPQAWAMALVIMRGCYPGKIKLTEMESAIWYETLKGYTNDQVIKAIPQMAKTAEFPSINALCSAIADSEELEYISAYAEAQRYCVLASSQTVKKNALGQIIFKPNGYPEMNEPEDIQVKDPLVKIIVANFGGAKKFLDRQNSAENTFFAQFRDAYKVARNRETARAALPFNVDNLVALMTMDRNKAHLAVKNFQPSILPPSSAQQEGGLLGK